MNHIAQFASGVGNCLIRLRIVESMNKYKYIQVSRHFDDGFFICEWSRSVMCKFNNFDYAIGLMCSKSKTTYRWSKRIKHFQVAQKYSQCYLFRSNWTKRLNFFIHIDKSWMWKFSKSLQFVSANGFWSCQIITTTTINIFIKWLYRE